MAAGVRVRGGKTERHVRSGSGRMSNPCVRWKDMPSPHFGLAEIPYSECVY